VVTLVAQALPDLLALAEKQGLPEQGLTEKQVIREPLALGIREPLVKQDLQAQLVRVAGIRATQEPRVKLVLPEPGLTEPQGLRALLV
jgi:hypothetical protein